MRLCPPGQPAIKMNGDHTALINPSTHGRLWPVSHKVWASFPPLASPSLPTEIKPEFPF